MGTAGAAAEYKNFTPILLTLVASNVAKAEALSGDTAGTPPPSAAAAAAAIGAPSSSISMSAGLISAGVPAPRPFLSSSWPADSSSQEPNKRGAIKLFFCFWAIFCGI